MLTRRQFSFTALSSVALATLPLAASVAAPVKAAGGDAITIIVPLPKNGPTDLMARFFAEPLSKALGQKVVVENITGDWGMTGSVIAAHADADGRTLVMGQTATHANLPVMTGRYDAINDFSQLGLLGVSPMVVLVRRDLPMNSLFALQAYMQSSPDHLRVANGGLGSASALTAKKMQTAFGASIMRESVYTGTAAALEDLAAGRVDVLCDQMISALPMIRAGKVKAIGMTGLSRNLAMPDVLTGAHQGFGDLRASNWTGLFAPKGLSADKQQRFAAAINTVLEDATVARQMREQGMHVPFAEQRGPEQLAALQRREMNDVATIYGAVA